MFTGIIDRAVAIQDIRILSQKSTELLIQTGYSKIQLGESIALNGVCLTVAASSKDGEASFYVSPETLSRTNLGDLKEGSLVNLERALTLDRSLSGHWVQGHVDGLAEVAGIEPLEESTQVTLRLTEALARYCVEKGSITVDGISLTVNDIQKTEKLSESLVFLTIIPHTWKHTHLHSTVVGHKANIEVDILAKYVERLCHPYMKPLKS
jgi:riboflavin synthase